MTDESNHQERQWFDERDLKYIDAENNPKLRETMICAVTTYRRPDRLEVGDPVPRLQLAELDSGNGIDLSASRNKPLVLIFGSYT